MRFASLAIDHGLLAPAMGIRRKEGERGVGMVALAMAGRRRRQRAATSFYGRCDWPA